MGNGVTVMMREIDVPIRVEGRHWGRFPDRVQASVQRRRHLERQYQPSGWRCTA
jgi:hypothetical protein